MSTRRVVLLGYPVAHSLSPLMHRAAFRAAGIDARYDAVEVPPGELGTRLAKLRDNRGAGNITSPHKVSALTLVDVISPAANLAGAINTFWTGERGELHGDNTDIEGFSSMVGELLGGVPRNARVGVLGSGGAAAAAITAISEWPGASVLVITRNMKRGRELKLRHSVVSGVEMMRPEALSAVNIVVNATPLGKDSGDALPVEIEELPSDALVVDLVYSPGETRLVRDARARGHRAADGLAMLLHQGARSFEKWFGFMPDTSVMWNALLEATGRREGAGA